MKITNQIIAAASFSALLFAPLAQAQVGTSDSDTKSITLEVISAGVSITATDISFGFVTPDANDSSPVDLVLACAGGTSTTSFAGGSESSFGGAPKCGTVTVRSESSENQNYALKVDVGSLTNSSGVVIIPTLTVIDQDGNPVAGIASGVTALTNAPGTETSNSIAIATSESDTYMLGGSAPIAANQATGTYSGNYTVTATVI